MVVPVDRTRGVARRKTTYKHDHEGQGTSGHEVGTCQLSVWPKAQGAANTNCAPLRRQSDKDTRVAPPDRLSDSCYQKQIQTKNVSAS